MVLYLHNSVQTLTIFVSLLVKTNRFHVTVHLFRSQKTSQKNVVRKSVTHLPQGHDSVVTTAFGIGSENNVLKHTNNRNNGAIPLKQQACVLYQSNEIRGYTELRGVCLSLLLEHFDIIFVRHVPNMHCFWRAQEILDLIN